MSERRGKMPRAEGWGGGRRVGPNEDCIIMGAAASDWKGVGRSAVEAGPIQPRCSADVVINEGAAQDQLPRMTEEEFKDLHSRDARISLAAEKLLKQRIKDMGLNPEQEGLVRVFIGDKEIKIGTGNDFGTVLSEDS